MKTRFIYLLLALPIFFGCATITVKAATDDAQLSKEERKLHKKQEKEARKLEKSREKEEQKREKELSKAKKAEEKELKKEQDKLKKEEKKREKEEQKNLKKQEEEKKKEEKARKKAEKEDLLAYKRSSEGKAEKKEDKRKKEQEKKERDEKKAEDRKLRAQAKKEERREKHHMKKEDRHQQWAKCDAEQEHKKLEKYNKVRDGRDNRSTLINRWVDYRTKEDAQERENGMYASLYKSPAWPMAAQFYENKHMLRVEASYQYATDSYDSTGRSSNTDITALEFGEGPILVKDVLLVSKLAELKKVIHYEDLSTTHNVTVSRLKTDGNRADTLLTMPWDADQYLKYLANEVLAFNGREEQYALNFDFSRYVFRNNIAIGVELPVVYKKHHLDLDMNLSDKATNPDGTDFTGGAYDLSGDHPNLFLRRYGVDPVRFTMDALRTKGFKEIGGSATGLGDIAAYINAQIDSVLFDKMVIGIRGQFPTAKKALQNRVWSPELGNGGFTEIAGFASVLMSYKKYANPHIMLQGNFNLKAHVDRRVPKRITYAGGDTDNTLYVSDKIDGLTFADRVKFAAEDGYPVMPETETGPESGEFFKAYPSVPFDDYDTAVKGLADNVVRVQITKGPEFKMRLGNMIERFIFVKSFLDIFYDFRAKAQDDITGLQADVYNTGILREHTQQLEHRLGFDYSYQFDLGSRLRLGMRYTFAGMNVPKTLDIIGSVDYSF